MSSYDIGDVVRLRATFRNVAGALADPAAVTLTVEAPDGTTTTPTPTSGSTGVWDALVTPDQSGVYRYRYVGVGVVDAAGQGMFTVRFDL